MRHKVLILGSLGEFTELVQMAGKKGYETVVCDGYPDGPARKYADRSYVIPVTEIDRIATLCREEQVDGIITSFSDLLLECMVKIADKAGLPCYLKPEQLPWYRDKSACRLLLEKLGLPSPGYKKISVDFLREKTETELAATVGELTYPLICKPLDKYGSRGIFIIHNPKEIRQKALQTAEYTSCEEILIEEYNDGYEFNMMTWVLEGQVYVLSLADREKTPVNQREIPISTRNVYPSCLMTEVYEDAREILQKVADYTGQKEGILSMQFFWNPRRGISVCEVAGRFLGYEHELIDYCSGLKVEDLLLDYAYDKESLARLVKGHQPFFHNCCAVLYFHGKPGKKIADQKTARRLGELEQVKECWLFYREGEIIEEHGRNPYVARYYIRGKDRKDLDRLTEKIYREISITDEKGEEVIYRNEIPSYPK